MTFNYSKSKLLFLLLTMSFCMVANAGRIFRPEVSVSVDANTGLGSIRGSIMGAVMSADANQYVECGLVAKGVPAVLYATCTAEDATGIASRTNCTTTDPLMMQTIAAISSTSYVMISIDSIPVNSRSGRCSQIWMRNGSFTL